MVGEDHERWVWEFDGQTCSEVTGRIDYTNSEQIVKDILNKCPCLPLLMGINPELDRRIGLKMKEY
jgi:hypothetical protein